jgi:hypothetical protein
MWAFVDEYSHNDTTLDRLRRSRGFCADHAERLRRLEVEGLKSNLGISNVYLDTLQGIQEELEALGAGDQHRQPEECPACRYRDEEVEKNARYLVEEVNENPRSQAWFLESNGICFPHLELVWQHTRTDGERHLLLEVQRRVIAELISDLSENIRKQGHEYAGEPSEKEDESWARAIRLTAGWPREVLRDPPVPPEERYRPPDFVTGRTPDKGSTG